MTVQWIPETELYEVVRQKGRAFDLATADVPRNGKPGIALGVGGSSNVRHIDAESVKKLLDEGALTYYDENGALGKKVQRFKENYFPQT